jgi:DNA-binding NarL/FixJ family response regulator
MTIITVKGKFVVLTQREVEALTHIGSGCCIKEVAELMGVSYSTAQKHVQSMRDRIGHLPQAKVAHIALANKLIKNITEV